MVKLILYGVNASPPVRACLLTLKALQLPYEYKMVNLSGGEHLSEDYLKKNPQHTVPTLEDDGQCIWDSHAIIAYLVRKYAKDDQLYPKDYYQRAIVDQRLHFDSSVIFQALAKVMLPVYFKNITEVTQEQVDGIIAVYDFMETFLKDKPYIAGDHLTIADYSLVANVTSLALIWQIDANKYEKLNAWVQRLEALPFYDEANTKGLQEYRELMRSFHMSVLSKPI